MPLKYFSSRQSLHSTPSPVPPSIIGQVNVPENVSVVVKNPVALICEASGIPLPAITWLKDARPVQASSSVRILSGRLLFDFDFFHYHYHCILNVSLKSNQRDANSQEISTVASLKQGHKPFCFLDEFHRGRAVAEDHCSVIVIGALLLRPNQIDEDHQGQLCWIESQDINEDISSALE